MTTLYTMILHQPCLNPRPVHVKRNLLHPRYPTVHPFKNIPTKTHDHHRFVPRSSRKPHGDEPRKASEGLYDLIKNQKNLRELILGVTGNECQVLRCVPFNLVVQSLVKKQGTLILSSLIAFAVKHLEFVARPTAEGGADVGFRWNFAWGSNSIPLGPASSIYTTHTYTGKILLRNGMAIIDPMLLRCGTLEKKLKEMATAVSDRIVPDGVLQGKKKDALLKFLLVLLAMAITLALWKNTFL